MDLNSHDHFLAEELLDKTQVIKTLFYLLDILCISQFELDSFEEWLSDP